MTELLADPALTGHASRFTLALLRASGLVVFCPVFGSLLLPTQFRATLALVLAFVMLPLTPVAADLVLEPGVWLMQAVRELIVGLGLGLAARAAFDGLEGAAMLISGQSGFSLSAMVDPFTGTQSATPVLFQTLLGTTVFLTADLHHLFITGLAHSYDLLPPSAEPLATAGLPAMVGQLGARLFGTAVELAAPGLVVTVAVDLVLVLVGRAIPQVPVLMVGYPLKVAGGVVGMMLLALGTGAAIRFIGSTFAADGVALLAALGGK